MLLRVCYYYIIIWWTGETIKNDKKTINGEHFKIREIIIFETTFLYVMK